MKKPSDRREHTPAAPSSALRDNHARGSVADFLNEKITPDSRLSFVSAYFTIYAYHRLKAVLDSIGHLDFLFGEPAFVNRLDPNKTEKKAFLLDAAGLKLANKLRQKRIAKECADWIERKVDIKTIRQSNLLHGKMYHVATPAGVEDAILGSSNFTVRGLGLGNGGNNLELNLIVDSNRDRQELKQWFDELWSSPTLVKDVKQEVLNYLKQLYDNHAPEFIYYKTLYHIFEKFLGDTGKTDVDLGKTSLFETGVWKALFEFQRDGVKGAINKILKHNGCIIADSVGLGKTYEALAVIKYFELKNERVLVLCPKKLRGNWTVYRTPDRLNPFDEDRFRFDVLSHTDLSRDKGYSGDINLATLNWGNFDLIVIDESHNFRNNTPGRRDEEGVLIRKSRYQRLMDDIIKSGVRTKVLLLSATPVNNDLKDLRNQLYFLTENRDDAFAESIGIGSLKETLATAQKVFTLWAKQHSSERKTGELMEKLNAGFFTLLDELTIARSRKHIQKYYKAGIAALGGFPERKKPVSLYPEIDLRGRFLSYDKLNDEIAGYRLTLFNPSKYVKNEFRPIYQTTGPDPFSQADRETYLIGMMKVNFLKRLESSVKSFEITMAHTIAKIEALEQKIRNFLATPDQNPEADQLELDLADPDPDDELEEAMLVGGKFKYKLEHLELDHGKNWLKDLKKDKDQLRILLNAAQNVSPSTDAKLAELKRLIAAKVANPTLNKDGAPNRKVLVFTAFADTAAYLYENLKSEQVSSLLPNVEQASSLLSSTGANVEQPSSLSNGQDARSTLSPEQASSLLPNVEQASSLLSPHNGPAAPSTLFSAYDRSTETHRTRRNLPHWVKDGKTYFVTFHLADSIPQDKLLVWKEEVAVWRSSHPEPWTENDWDEYNAFVEQKEQWLDAGHGSCALKDGDLREIVESALLHFDGVRYILDEFVVMPNHVHALLKPLGEHKLSDILHSWKSFTATAINKKRNRRGAFWQDENFDHIVRSWSHLEHFRTYIRNNPTGILNLKSRHGINVAQASHTGANVEQASSLLSSHNGTNVEQASSLLSPHNGANVEQASSLLSSHNSANVEQASSLLSSHNGQDARSTFHLALVTGSGANRTTFGATDFDAILTNFSPVSKNRAKIPGMPQQGEIDLLIATDCISEGQNLQDCDYLINYDIHWNPVRIIQRFGRIDRIHSAGRAVQIVNFWPTEDLNKYINLKNRVEARMALVDIAATFEDNILKNAEIEDIVSEDLRYRDKQLLRLKDEVLDIEDLGDSVSLTEFTLDDFRLELLKYIEANRDVLESAPFGLYTCVPPHPEYKVIAPGVIFCFRQEGLCEADPAAKPDSGASINPLQPYFLVYVLADGNVRFGFAHPKQILDIYRILCSGKGEPYTRLCDLFDRQTDHGSDMKDYDTLLDKAVASLAATFRKRAASGLTSSRGFILPDEREQIHDKTDLELVTWLVIKEPTE